MKLNEQLKSYFTKCGHINASFYEGKACINVSLRFRTFYLSLDRQEILSGLKTLKKTYPRGQVFSFHSVN